MNRLFFVIVAMLCSLPVFAEDYFYAESTHGTGGTLHAWVEGAKSIPEKSASFLWVGDYRESDYHSLALGIGHEWGGLSAVVFAGHENDSGKNQGLVGGFAYHRADRDETYFFFEKSRGGGTFHKAFARYYPGNHVFFGVAKESDLALGPTVGVKIDKVKLWVYAPAKARREGHKVVLGASVEF